MGGTGLYIRTLMQGPTGAPSSTAESKAMVDTMVEQDGGSWEARWAWLMDAALLQSYAFNRELQASLHNLAVTGRKQTLFAISFLELFTML